MPAVTAWLRSALLAAPLIVFVCAEQKHITAESGQDVTLTCRAPNNEIAVVEWSRADLGNEYVLLYRDGHFVSDHQHPSFMNRVDLQDRQMKDGDVSVILKDVTITDSGTYECHVFMVGDKQPMNPISIIYLQVVPPGHTGGGRVDGLYELTFGVGVALSLCVVIAVVGFCTYRCRLSRGPNERPVNQNTNGPRQTPQQNCELADLRTGRV